MCKNGNKVVKKTVNIGEKAVIDKNGTISITAKDGKNTKLYTANGELANGTVNGKMYQQGVLANGTLNGKLYSNGELTNGIVNGKMYQRGVFANGTVNGKMYQQGELANGTVNGKLYKNGTKVNGTVNGKLYLSGTLANWTVNGKLYKNGTLVNGTVNGKMYQQGVLANGVFNNELYKDGVLYEGLYEFEEKVYQNGILAQGKIDGRLYQNGVPVNGTISGKIYIDGMEYPLLTIDSIVSKYSGLPNDSENAVTNEDGSVTITSKDGKIVEVYSMIADNKVNLKEYQNGKLIKETLFTGDGGKMIIEYKVVGAETIIVSIEKYDNQDRKIYTEKHTWDINGVETLEKEEWKYELLTDKLVKHTYIKDVGNDELVEKTIDDNYKYDKFGQKIHETHMTSVINEDRVKEITLSEGKYIYDNKGRKTGEYSYNKRPDGTANERINFYREGYPWGWVQDPSYTASYDQFGNIKSCSVGDWSIWGTEWSSCAISTYLNAKDKFPSGPIF